MQVSAKYYILNITIEFWVKLYLPDCDTHYMYLFYLAQ